MLVRHLTRLHIATAISAVFLFFLLGLIVLTEKNLKLSTVPLDIPSGPDNSPQISLETTAPATAGYVKPLPAGFQKYFISHHQSISQPFPVEASFDPQDPPLASTQKVTLVVKSDDPVTKVTVRLHSDNQVADEQPMKLISQTDNESVWLAMVGITDTLYHNYQAEFFVQSTSGSWHDSITFR